MNFERNTFEHSASDNGANSVAMLISVIGIFLALLGVEGLLTAGWMAALICWAFVVLGACTFGLGLTLRYSCQE